MKPIGILLTALAISLVATAARGLGATANRQAKLSEKQATEIGTEFTSTAIT
jgi:hypothetical protein